MGIMACHMQIDMLNATYMSLQVFAERGHSLWRMSIYVLASVCRKRSWCRSFDMTCAGLLVNKLCELPIQTWQVDQNIS